jgi:hypothetical protein
MVQRDDEIFHLYFVLTTEKIKLLLAFLQYCTYETYKEFKFINSGATTGYLRVLERGGGIYRKQAWHTPTP